MRKEVIIGVDVSKAWLDAYILAKGISGDPALRITNSAAGFTKLCRRITQLTQVPTDQWLFCMEHTGLYTYKLNAFLQQSGICQTMVNPLAIKKSMGIIRGKNDKADARVIANYASRFMDTLVPFQMPATTLQKLKIQLSQRERMVDMKRQIDLAMQSVRDLPREVVAEINSQNKKIMAQLIKNVKVLDKAIKETIASDKSLERQAKRIESVPGIGPQTSAHILVTTQGMTLFKNSRKYACYAGVAPFEYSSGSSFRSKTKVHYLANRKVKSLLHMAAMNAITFDPEIKAYYERKKAEGKNPMSIINAVRFKLIDRIFAVIRTDRTYQKNYLQSAA